MRINSKDKHGDSILDIVILALLCVAMLLVSIAIIGQIL